MANLINDEELARIIRRELNAGMIQAAEPIIKKALADMEEQMRGRLAEMLVRFVDRNYSLERNGHNLLVRVELGKTESKGNEV